MAAVETFPEVLLMSKLNGSLQLKSLFQKLYSFRVGVEWVFRVGVGGRKRSRSRGRSRGKKNQGVGHSLLCFR
ncbi:MAG: hypothetical protein DRJ14_03455 [Acidobacteria bacterium]|nr:MAG: hypothetical protein DRJ14_03455 [Acidobacteriota bacterium]